MLAWLHTYVRQLDVYPQQRAFARTLLPLTDAQAHPTTLAAVEGQLIMVLALLAHRGLDENTAPEGFVAVVVLALQPPVRNASPDRHCEANSSVVVFQC